MLYTIKEAANQLGITYWMLYWNLKNDRIPKPKIRTTNRYLFSDDEINALKPRVVRCNKGGRLKNI